MTEPGEFVIDNRERARVALISFVVGGAAGPVGWERPRVAGGIAAIALVLLGAVGTGTGLALAVAVFRHRSERRRISAAVEDGATPRRS